MRLIRCTLGYCRGLFIIYFFMVLPPRSRILLDNTMYTGAVTNQPFRSPSCTPCISNRELRPALFKATLCLIKLPLANQGSRPRSPPSQRNFPPRDPQPRGVKGLFFRVVSVRISTRVFHDRCGWLRRGFAHSEVAWHCPGNLVNLQCLQAVMNSYWARGSQPRQSARSLVGCCRVSIPRCAKCPRSTMIRQLRLPSITIMR